MSLMTINLNKSRGQYRNHFADVTQEWGLSRILGRKEREKS